MQPTEVRGPVRALPGDSWEALVRMRILKPHGGTTEEAAEKLRLRGNTEENHPSAAEAVARFA